MLLFVTLRSSSDCTSISQTLLSALVSEPVSRTLLFNSAGWEKKRARDRCVNISLPSQEDGVFRSKVRGLVLKGHCQAENGLELGLEIEPALWEYIHSWIPAPLLILKTRPESHCGQRGYVAQVGVSLHLVLMSPYLCASTQALWLSCSANLAGSQATSKACSFFCPFEFSHTLQI